LIHRSNSCPHRLSRQDFATARSLLEQAIAQAPPALPPRVYHTHVLLQENRDPSAVEEALRDLLALGPSDGEARHNLTLLLRRRGQSQSA
jgi:Tfp pilus assembly protein PilF